MPVATTPEQRAAAEAVRAWAARARPPVIARAGESDGSAWRAAWPALAELGLFAVGVPAAVGGAGGTVEDLAAMLAAAAEQLAPGPVVGTVLAAQLLARRGPSDLLDDVLSGALSVALGTTAVTVNADGPVGAEGAVAGERPVLLDGSTTAVGGDLTSATLVPLSDGRWALLDGGSGKRAERTAADLSRPVVELHCAGIAVDHDRLFDGAGAGDLLVTLLAAEAAGVAAWCLQTAVEYAKVREQFGRPIGSFQAVQHLCAEMLCRVQQAEVAAADAARATGTAEHPLAAAVAGSVALDAALANAKDCIQVLGGIGFTWEHDAHLYLRRAVSIRALAGGSGRWRRRVAELTRAGTRRTLSVDLGPREADRAIVRTVVKAIAALPVERRRDALVDSGYLTPHWPAPYGRDADAAEQLLIDQELSRAGVERPDLVIGAWAVPTILEAGTPEQIERFVGPTLRGKLAWCQLFSEPEAGSDLASLRTRAVRVDGGWRLDGQKVWTSQARTADWGICLARTNPDAPKHNGITYFLVDMRSAGIDIRPLREITGEALFNEVFLDGVVVPDACVVGEVDGGWRLARSTLANERVAMGGSSSIGDAVEQLLVAAAADDDPVLLDRLGALVAEGIAGSLLDQRAVLRRLAGQQPGAESSVRKLVGVRHRQAVAEAALDLLGPDAVAGSPQLQEFLLTRCLSIAGGTTQVLLTLAAERILGLPRA